MFADKGDLDRGITDFDQAIRFDPKNVSAFENLGNTYFIKKDYDRAVAYFDQAVRLAPNDAAALYGRGKAKQLKGDIAGGDADVASAGSTYRQVIVLRPCRTDTGDQNHKRKGPCKAAHLGAPARSSQCHRALVAPGRAAVQKTPARSARQAAPLSGEVASFLCGTMRRGKPELCPIAPLRRLEHAAIKHNRIVLFISLILEHEKSATFRDHAPACR